jgi:hypothetical protein
VPGRKSGFELDARGGSYVSFWSLKGLLLEGRDWLGGREREREEIVWWKTGKRRERGSVRKERERRKLRRENR